VTRRPTARSPGRGRGDGSRGDGSRGDGGQATVEFAMLLPVAFIAALLVVQVGLVVRDQILVVHAAREGARAAAADGGDAGAARAGVAAASGLVPNGGVDVRSGGDRVTVTVRHRSSTDLPLVGGFVPDVSVEGTATMRIEPEA